MKKRLLLCLTLTYCVGIIFGGTSIGKQFWEKRIPKHTYKNEIEGMAELENENAKAGESDEEKRVADIDPIVQTQKAKTQNVDEMNYDYLLKNYFQVDKVTTLEPSLIDAKTMSETNMAIDRNVDGPQILIYHTHSQETYADSIPGDSSTTVVGVGDYLEKILTEKYGYKVLHHKGEYDVGDRDHAYSNALPEIQQILSDNPSIQVVIDLHRDAVPDTTKLVTEINGNPTAKIMFFNGVSKTVQRGNIDSLPNPYLQNELALSFQMQKAAYENYPGLTRKIYIKGYRYNMHMSSKSMLIEVGAQNNTVQEAKNAMEPLADLLNKVLQ